MKIIDVNVLLYAVNAEAPQHAQSRMWLEEALGGSEPLAIAWITVAGFLRISTHPRIFSQPLAGTEAVQIIQAWFDSPLVSVVEAISEHWQILRELLLVFGTAGNLTPDAHLAALAIAHGATMVSCDTDFSRYRRLKWENPLAVP